MTDKKNINNSLKNQDKNFNKNSTHENNQIIIDGCNVSGCSYYNPLGNYNCGGTKKCSQWSNCYFKQLARKMQECEQIKEKYEALKLENQEGYEIIDELRQECEELKRKLSNQEQLYQNEIEIYNESCLQLRQENDDLYLERLALNTANSGINALLEVKEQECDRCRKALEEIKKVCIKDTREFADGTQIRYDSLDEILNIIKTIDE